jgi:hypothetical protein
MKSNIVDTHRIRVFGEIPHSEGRLLSRNSTTAGDWSGLQLRDPSWCPLINQNWVFTMPTGFKLRTDGVSTVTSGKEFDFTKSKRISRIAMSEGAVNSMYQDPSGEYFLHLFKPQIDEIVRLDQEQANKLASIVSEDGTFPEGALEQAGIFPEEDIHDAFFGIPGDLADRLQDLADKQDLELDEFIIQSLERIARSGCM